MRKLTGNTEIDDSLRRLDILTREEARMAIAENLKMTHSVDDRVMSIDDRVKSVEGNVQYVRSDVRDVEHTVQSISSNISSRVRGVDDKLDQVNRSSL
jgi:hypothetical protein